MNNKPTRKRYSVLSDEIGFFVGREIYDEAQNKWVFHERCTNYMTEEKINEVFTETER